jgi:hypothetical protein
MSDVLKENDDEKDDDKEKLVIIDEEQESEDDRVDDERVLSSSDENDGERAAIRERRRHEKLERKDRRGKAINRDKIELDFLRKRNDDLERRVSAQEHRSHQADLNGIDAQIAKSTHDVSLAEGIIAKAIESGNGSDVTQAMRYRDQAIARAQHLSREKQNTEKLPAPKSTLDDATMHYAREFIKDNPWYDAQGRDEASAIVLAIDAALSKDGYNPQTEEYWDELRSRSARRLPERFGKDSSQSRAPRGGPVISSGRDNGSTSTSKEFFLSKERKQALIDAGVWDDPILRDKYAKRYREYDKANRA